MGKVSRIKSKIRERIHVAREDFLFVKNIDQYMNLLRSRHREMNHKGGSRNTVLGGFNTR